MDLVTHALVGAATGAVWHEPWIGAAIAVIPDMTLFSFKRRERPTPLYDASHSIFGLACVTLTVAVVAPELVLLAFFSYLSHLYLDWPTHGQHWGPPLLYPNPMRFRLDNGEWEFFNPIWFRGLIYAITWTFACTLLLAIGSL